MNHASMVVHHSVGRWTFIKSSIFYLVTKKRKNPFNMRVCKLCCALELRETLGGSTVHRVESFNESGLRNFFPRQHQFSLILIVSLNCGSMNRSGCSPG